jgi:hypothetical protein
MKARKTLFMNRLNLIAIAFGLMILAACKKQFNTEQNLPDEASSKEKTTALAACQPGMYNLAVDSVTGFSYVYKVTGSPGAGPITVTPYIVSGNNQLKTCSGVPIRFATGLAFDPATGIFYGTTGAASSPANYILKFTDPNCVTASPAVTTCGISLDLSDVERDPSTNAYYAINRGTVAPNNRIVKLGLPGGPSVSCLPNPLPVGLRMRGLTFNCNGQLYVMHTSGTNGIIVNINKTTGLNVGSFAYPGPIAPAAAVATPEIGLHFDCACIGRFITGNFNPHFLAPMMTDGLPAGMGGPIYNVASAVLRPTVDFARPN